MDFFRLVKELMILLDSKQRKNLLILQVLIVLMAIMELIGIASIGPFMAVISNKNIIESNYILNKLYILTGASSKDDFLLIMGGVVLISIAFGSILSIYTTWRSSLFASTLGVQLSDRLYKYYISNSWIFHLNKNSSDLINNISVEALRVTNLIIQPIILMNSKIILATIILIAIVIYNPLVAIVGAIIFIMSYFIIYKLFSSRLREHGEDISKGNSTRFRLMGEGFGGVKDLIMLQRSDKYTNEFIKIGHNLSYAHGSSFALSSIPRYIMEFVAFGSVVILILYLISTTGGESNFLPIISVYALAGLKLLPAMQQIYSSFAIIKGSYPSFEAIKNDLYDSRFILNENKQVKVKEIQFKNIIQFYGVEYSYPEQRKKSLDNINININVGDFIGIVGASGSGKSTLINLILGLIEPTAGKILIDDTELNKETVKSWRTHIGYVPQNVFLIEATISENITLGLEKDKINHKKVLNALSDAGLGEWLNSHSRVFDETVGERGEKLSGGQKQRVGIARALYDDKQVLVLDEITSALDRISEETVMKTINNLRKSKTIIMITHKMETIKDCNKIFLVEDGRVIDSGNYDDLSKKHSIF